MGEHLRARRVSSSTGAVLSCSILGRQTLLRIIDVDGVRVVIARGYDASTPEAEVATMEQGMGSEQIEA